VSLSFSCFATMMLVLTIPALAQTATVPVLDDGRHAGVTSILKQLSAGAQDSAPFCLTVRINRQLARPDTAALADSLGRRILTSGGCPPTYAQMGCYVEPGTTQCAGPGRPPGYIDPHRVTIDFPGRNGKQVIEAKIQQGTLGAIYECRPLNRAERPCLQTGSVIN
jgi:hypothetical protein